MHENQRDNGRVFTKVTTACVVVSVGIDACGTIGKFKGCSCEDRVTFSLEPMHHS